MQQTRTFEIDKPVHEVFEEWMHFEEFPRRITEVKEVRKIDDRRSHWVAEAMGIRKEWDAEITDSQPNRRIAWRSISGFQNSGEVLFDSIGNNRTRVTVNFHFEPLGVSDDMVDEEAEHLVQEAQTSL